jgi:hypothetical protein
MKHQTPPTRMQENVDDGVGDIKPVSANWGFSLMSSLFELETMV